MDQGGGGLMQILSQLQGGGGMPPGPAQGMPMGGPSEAAEGNPLMMLLMQLLAGSGGQGMPQGGGY